MGELSMPMVFGFAVVLTAGIIGDWLLFRQTGRAGILSLIPVVNVMVEYSI